jgi:hypothetical protein
MAGSTQAAGAREKNIGLCKNLSRSAKKSKENKATVTHHHHLQLGERMHNSPLSGSAVIQKRGAALLQSPPVHFPGTQEKKNRRLFPS